MDFVFILGFALIAVAVVALVMSLVVACLAAVTWALRAERSSVLVNVAATAGLAALALSKWPGIPSIWSVAEVISGAAAAGAIVYALCRREPPTANESAKPQPSLL